MDIAEAGIGNDFGDLLIGDELSHVYGDDDDTRFDFVMVSPQQQVEITEYLQSQRPLQMARTPGELVANDLRLAVRIKWICVYLGMLPHDVEHFQFCKSLADTLYPAWRGYDPFSSQIGEMAA